MSDETSTRSNRVQFRIMLRNMLPEALGELQGNSATANDTAFVEDATQEAQRLALQLVRECELPWIPRVGEDVWANPNWDPVVVERVEWNLDPAADECLVTVHLEDLDEDEVGPEWGAAEILLESGWRPAVDI